MVMAAILKNTVPGVVGRAPRRIMFLYGLTVKYAKFGALDQRVTIFLLSHRTITRPYKAFFVFLSFNIFY